MHVPIGSSGRSRQNLPGLELEPLRRRAWAGALLALIIGFCIALPGARVFIASAAKAFSEKDAIDQSAIIATILSLFGGFTWMGSVIGLREVEALRRQRNAAMDQVRGTEEKITRVEKALKRREQDMVLLERQIPDELVRNYERARAQRGPSDDLVLLMKNGLEGILPPTGQACNILGSMLLEREEPGDLEAAEHLLGIAAAIDLKNATSTNAAALREYKAAASFRIGAYNGDSRQFTPIAQFSAYGIEEKVEQLRHRAYEAMQNGDYRSGERFCRRAIVELEANGETRSRLWFATRFDLAQMLDGLGQWTAALEEADATLHLARGSLDPDDEIILHLRHVRAEALFDLGQISPAIEAFRLVEIDRVRVKGDDDEAALNSGHYLARALFVGGYLAESLSKVEQIISARRSILGSDHKHTLNSEFLKLEIDIQNASDAVSLERVDELLMRSTKSLGKNHPDVLAIRHVRALQLHRSGDASGAKTELTPAISMMRQFLGPQHPYTRRAEETLRHL